MSTTNTNAVPVGEQSPLGSFGSISGVSVSSVFSTGSGSTKGDGVIWGGQATPVGHKNDFLPFGTPTNAAPPSSDQFHASFGGTPIATATSSETIMSGGYGVSSTAWNQNSFTPQIISSASSGSAQSGMGPTMSTATGSAGFTGGMQSSTTSDSTDFFGRAGGMKFAASGTTSM